MLLEDVSRTVISHLPPKPCEELAGSFLVWNMVNFVMHHYFVRNVDEARSVIEDLIGEQLKDNSITDNAFGLMVCVEEIADARTHEYDSYTWEEWSDEDGNDIMGE